MNGTSCRRKPCSLKPCRRKPCGRLHIMVMILSIIMILSGCSSYPETAADGSTWDRSWTILGRVLGVEEPGHDLQLSENPVVLTGRDLYYATWTIGEAEQYVNEEGKDADLYPAELYLVVCGSAKDGNTPQENIDDWIAREYETYEVLNRTEETINGQVYILLEYNVKSETNPFSHGIAAFAVYSSYAISAELTCQDTFDGDLHQILTDYLQGCHYNKEI